MTAGRSGGGLFFTLLKLSAEIFFEKKLARALVFIVNYITI
jgi:hypothetical protein